MNSGLNLSPVTYSADGEGKVEDPNGLRTEPMFIRKRWDDACRKVNFEVISEENKVLKAPPGRGVWHGEYREIGLRRWFSLVAKLTSAGQQTNLCRN